MSVHLPQPSGSAKIYATASKEWVIPPKLKPGRKPKTIPKDDLEFENDTTEQGKKSQNRSAQRAFRERRQTQLSELQARIKQYEQGEVERSVTLQTIGIRLKAENETLKEQNKKLKEENEQLKARLDDLTSAAVPAAHPVSAATTLHRGVKRGRVESPSLSAVSLKRLRITESPHPGVSSLNTPCSSSTHSVSSHTQFKDANEHFMDDQYDSTSPITENGNLGLDPHVAHVSCGMCTSSIDCVCRELGLGDPMDPLPNEDEDATMSMLDRRGSYPFAAAAAPSAHAKLSSLSNGPVTSTKDSTAHGENTPTGCSGDPRDCSACKDNEFGRAFCTALGNSVCMLNPCPTCQLKTGPSSSLESEDTIMVPVDDEPILPLTINPTLTQCCGDPAHCKGGACSPAAPKASPSSSSRETSRRRNKPSSSHAPLRIVTTERGSDTVSCDVVWKALEAHPNAHLVNPIAGPSQLANLHLLADVVAGRSYCTLAPGEPTPEPEDFPRRARPRPPRPNSPHNHPHTRGGQGRLNAMDTSEGAVGDHADARVTIAYEDEQSWDGRERERAMVPRDVLQGHQRITSVPREGMRDAIALLNQQFGCS